VKSVAIDLPSLPPPPQITINFAAFLNNLTLITWFQLFGTNCFNSKYTKDSSSSSSSSSLLSVSAVKKEEGNEENGEGGRDLSEEELESSLNLIELVKQHANERVCDLNQTVYDLIFDYVSVSAYPYYLSLTLLY
jgi:hypothetical protein